VWSGGGWGPRYLVPALPFAACLALPVVERVAWQGGALRLAVLGLVAFGVVAQMLGVAKHPNLYTIMFRDHVLPSLPDYGAPLGGPPAMAYCQHFGGPGAGRQLDRPPDDELQDPPDPPRGLGYLFAEQGPLTLEFVPARDTSFALSLYTCDWDHRGRRQVITLEDAAGRRTYAQSYDFSGCEHLTWGVTARAGVPIRVSVHATGPDTPVLSGAFFDPARGPRQDEPQRDTSTRGGWAGKYGADGYVLFAWRRGGEDVRRLPDYLSGASGGDRDWIDTGEADLEDTALLYAPAFSPLLAHAWLLGCDAISLLFPRNVALLQRALGSPPWRYFGLAIHPPHPEYGLGLDFWPLLLRDQFSSHRGFMALVWSVEAGLAAGAAAGALALARRLRCPAEDPRCEPR
jgi:hypothetical protein